MNLGRSGIRGMGETELERRIEVAICVCVYTVGGCVYFKCFCAQEKGYLDGSCAVSLVFVCDMKVTGI
ncbi:hypothetical protein Hanom_Chr14g01272991 [Helianthus anomalus]